MPVFADRVRVKTATTGTGSVSLGAAVDTFQTFDDGGIPNGATVSYVIEDGSSIEIGTGTYDSGAGTLTRTTVHRSIVSGVAGTSTLNLSGDAEVFVTARAADLAAIAAQAVPAGLISMWSGATVQSIPAGWALCDGTQGTPDLRDRFIVGAGASYAPGATGGATSVTLTEGQMPSHTHTFSGSTNTTGAHSHDYDKSDTRAGAASPQVGIGSNTYTTTPTTSAGDHAHTFSGTTGSKGSGQSHENRPPFYALAYIMKL